MPECQSMYELHRSIMKRGEGVGQGEAGLGLCLTGQGKGWVGRSWGGVGQGTGMFFA